MGIHETKLSVPKSSGQSANNAETELLPKPHCRLVRGDYKIELHRAESKSASFAKTVFAHVPANSQSACRRRNHERGIGDM